MKKQFFVQCELERLENGVLHKMTCWIQEKHKLGSKIKDEANNIWIIKSKGKTLLEEDEANDMTQKYKRHRKATDISRTPNFLKDSGLA